MGILVLTDPLPSEIYAAALREIAGDVPVWTASDQPDPDRVEAILAWKLGAGVLSRYPNLRVLASIGAGADGLLGIPDLPADVVITRAVDPGQAIEIAQYVVASVLYFTRDLATYVRQQAVAAFRRLPVRSAERCRVGVLGMGNVGQAIARAFLPLGYPVSGWNRSPRAVSGVNVVSGAQALPEFMASVDILVCALPLTPSTRGILDRRNLGALPKGAIVLNVGRGQHLVEDDLRALLDEGHLGGAVLDVFSEEPPAPESWFWKHEKVLATPHIASTSSLPLVAGQCLDALHRTRQGLTQPNAVDRELGY
ncbi:2-hydroxyacid dehydrogenase [Paraburkholderia pallida]|uniref:Glyoxylate/hydroxypyruvate reductase A n=1 Tax=Paraburkholderia pallida TaxID=2547399 RepID=A0A4P7D417_9BURK|nr:glyoxylate/hydroxypyruvate reductase A [Paraburkholderia pallida]QBR03409.1 glyoxylate/hydroxypyruvate reductase A [Paraburkholderia pallida]